jgi:hypothetical protein
MKKHAEEDEFIFRTVRTCQFVAVMHFVSSNIHSGAASNCSVKVERRERESESNKERERLKRYVEE